MTKLLIVLSMVMMVAAMAGAQEGQQQAEGAHDADYVDSDRVIGSDAGKDAFNGMLDAVNSADERVKGFTGELQKAIDQAVLND